MSTPSPTDGNDLNPTAPSRRPPTPPGEGERRAQRGYTNQYDAAAAAIYHGLDQRTLRWIGLADREAGIADDVLLGYDHEVIGHQFKNSLNPGTFRIRTLFAGANGLIPGLVAAWRKLKDSCPGQDIRIRAVVSDSPADNDDEDGTGTSRQFIAHWQRHPGWTVTDWRNSAWWPTLEQFRASTDLDEHEFAEFFQSLEIVHGAQPDFSMRYGITAQSRPQVERIAQRLPVLIARNPDKDRWTREEFLGEMGWRDTEPRRHHQFPIGVAVQRNPATEVQLRAVLNANLSGYISLIGPPGSGKSTLLQIALEAEPQLVIVRYLAYVPRTAQGVGRAEAFDFYDDLIAGLRRSGLTGVRFRRESMQEQREEFEGLMAAAAERYRDSCVRTLLVVDGLDHIPREERPQQSLLSALPLPDAVPEGVLFLLGSQRLDLAGIPPSVQEQADSPSRRVAMSPLLQGAVSAMADILGLPPSVSRSRLLELAHGHPLATHYLIEALLAAESDEARESILEDGFEYSGDIEAYYAAALRGIADDNEVMDVLRLVALAEAPLDLNLLDGFYSTQTIEKAWGVARHLLKRSQAGWTTFHNSFRLFVTRAPRLQFGEPDTGVTSRLYRRLVDLADRPDAPSAQRFLKLRYLMRLGEHRTVLDLATPAYFRAQYVAGRSASDIQDDIRLAFHSLSHVQDPFAAFNLLLASDEMFRRSSVFEENEETLQALIALGRIDDAEAFLDEIGGDGYLVLDAWLKRGHVDRARALFERIEPLHDLGSGSLSNTPKARQKELARWAEYAVHFRTAAEIVAGTERIVDLVRREEDQFSDPDEIGASIRWQAASATVGSNPRVDVDEVVAAYQLDAREGATLRVYAALRILEGRFPHETDAAVSALEKIAADASVLAELPRGLRRRVALLAARAGWMTVARSLSDGLGVPAVSDLDDSTEYDHFTSVAVAIVQYAELMSLLDRPIPEVPRSRKPLLAPLQQFAERAGVLAARARRSPDLVQAGEVAHECGSFLRYVSRARASGGRDFFDSGQLGRAAPQVMKSLLKTAAQVSSQAFSMGVESIDQVLADSSTDRGRTVLLEELVAEGIAQLGDDAEEAARRLDGLLDRRDQGTPGQFIGSTARLAKAFARIRRPDRGNALLAEQRSQTLGYALRAKKDPQYAFWLTLMRNACRQDPSRRAERVLVLARQAVGMASTEGHEAAARMAHGLIREAALDSPGLAWAVTNALLQAGLVELPDAIDAIALGSVQRVPDLLAACIDIWTSLCLPFHRAAYYRVSQEADFIREAIRLSGPDAADQTVELLLESLMVHGQVDVRPDLLTSLKDAAVAQGLRLTSIEEAEASVARDVPLRRSGGDTPMRYDDISDMRALSERLRLDATSASPGYEAARAFQRLVATSDLRTALTVFERHEEIHDDNRARFDLVDRALAAGARDVAERLTRDYRFDTDRSFSWSWMMGGGRQRYFGARLKLEGAAVHDLAYANFATSLAAGDDATSSMLWNVKEIWPLLDPAPDWPRMWATVAEQLGHTRDHALGVDIEVQGAMSDTDLIAKLLFTVLSLPVSELQWHAGRGASALARSHPVGFVALIRMLMQDGGDSAITALRLLRTTASLPVQRELAADVAALANDGDFGVRGLARALLEDWGQDVEFGHSDLPAFYGLALPPVGPSTADRTLRASPLGAPLVSDPASWCAPFEDLVQTMAASADVTEDHIRHRVQQLLDAWGGVTSFGSEASKRLRVTLGTLGFRLNYFHPHITGALRALRHVGGELESAGRIDADEAADLLEEFFISPEWWRTAIDRRPSCVIRPRMPSGFGSEGEEWVQAVSEDLASIDGTDIILAEITRFTGRGSFRLYEWSRMRLLGTELPSHLDPIRLFDGLWQIRFPARAVTQPALDLIPKFQLTLEPSFAQALGWTPVSNLPIRWVDGEGQVVATAYCWRDGNDDGQSHGDCLYGEGAVIVLSEVGLVQVEALVGPRLLHSVARRAVTHDGTTREAYASTSDSGGARPGHWVPGD